MKKVIALGLIAITFGVAAPVRGVPLLAFRFTGSASLPTFPCLPGGCTGSFSGTAVGRSENTGINVTGPISALFVYSESHACVQGAASGSGTINGLHFHFQWNRMGNVARLTGQVDNQHFSAWATFRTTPAVPAGCLPGGVPGAVTATVIGEATGRLSL